MILTAIVIAVVTKGVSTAAFAPKVATCGIASMLVPFITAASPTAAHATLVQHVAGKVPAGVVVLVVLATDPTSATATNRDGVSLVPLCAVLAASP